MTLKANVRALQKHLATTSTDDDVRAISELMDELGAAAGSRHSGSTPAQINPSTIAELFESLVADTESPQHD
ncbi:hypothetical protein [Pseudomonas sp. dw_358]|uniref:hypothetical protein n=1 Tax=Pseudomonas sp. dw_358 TaxID=2720083 RepID=UPI001BD31453|nr:hypothetical protein [Pseudomonas sp. dw_358]